MPVCGGSFVPRLFPVQLFAALGAMLRMTAGISRSDRCSSSDSAPWTPATARPAPPAHRRRPAASWIHQQSNRTGAATDSIAAAKSSIRLQAVFQAQLLHRGDLPFAPAYHIRRRYTTGGFPCSNLIRSSRTAPCRCTSSFTAPSARISPSGALFGRRAAPPSKRQLAANLRVSLITVETAYGQLTAEGYLVSAPRRGYFVQQQLSPPPAPRAVPSRAADDRPCGAAASTISARISSITAAFRSPHGRG